jgi:rhodanese-related sulfurtransferase
MHKFKTYLAVVLLAGAILTVTLPIAFASPHSDIDVSTAWNMMTSGQYPNLVILDSRNQSEYDTGYIPRAILMPLWQLQQRIGELSAYKNSEIIVYCKTGDRSQNASLLLDANGFTKVYDMNGGIAAWNSSGYPISTPAAGYIETIGALTGANFVVRIPNNWNGMLLVFCRGYDPNIVLDARTGFYKAQATPVLNKGFAYAASSYGAGGYCISKAVNSTYELTKYLVDTFRITGKVFLFGSSMGSTVVLLLAEKYPRIYSGAMEISGGGDNKGQYFHYATIVNSTIPEIRSYLNTSSINPDSMLEGLKYLAGNGTRDMEIETGGTPQTQPKAYEDRDPMYHANIAIPVISIHSSGDMVVPLSQITAYQTAVANAGRSSLYRLYVTPPNLPGTGHVDANVQAQVGTRFDELVSWSEELRPTLRASAFCSVTVMPNWTWYFFVHCSGGVGANSYQWYEGMTLLAGQTSMILPVTKTLAGTYTFYCKVTDAEGKTANSNSVTLTVMQ